MEQTQFTEPKFNKLWQIVDDCIKTGRYKQIKGHLSDKKDGRCINGVFMSYCMNYKDPWDLKIDDGKTSEDAIIDFFENVLTVKYRYIATPHADFDRIQKMNDNDLIIEELKKVYKETGYIDNSYISKLNNNDMSFEEIRDLLKEMDV